MTEAKVRIGLVGANVRYGWGMRAHVPALKALPEYELKAVCTTRRETAEESASAFGAELAFADYRAMVSHPDIDAVSVCVRVPYHYEIAKAALQAGKHVFCEWPLGASTAEAEELAELADAQGVRHMVGLQARGDPVLLRLRELIAEGYIGEVLACNMTMFLPGILERTSERAWAADRAKGAHALSIAGGHSIDALCFCLGEFAEVSARVATQVKQWRIIDTGSTVDVDAPDNVLVSGVLESGALASIHVSSVPWHGSGWRMEIYGRDGTLVASSAQMVQMAQISLRGAKGGDKVLVDLPVPDRLTWVPEGTPKGPPFNVAQLFRKLADGIQEGRAVDPDFNLAVRRHRLLDALQRSSDEGKAVRVGA